MSVYVPVRTVTGRCTQAVASLAEAASVHAPVRASRRLAHCYGVFVRAPVCKSRAHGCVKCAPGYEQAAASLAIAGVLFVHVRDAKRLRRGYGRTQTITLLTIAGATFLRVASVRAPVREALPLRLRGGARKVSPRSPLEGSLCMREARATRLRVLSTSCRVATIAGGKADVVCAYGTPRASILQPLPRRRLAHQWTSDSFVLPPLPNRQLMDRGSSDDIERVPGKLNMLQWHHETQTPLPVNLAKEWFKGVDCVCIRTPTLTHGLRALVYFKLAISGPGRDPPFRCVRVYPFLYSSFCFLISFFDFVALDLIITPTSSDPNYFLTFA
ncbi:hypothetical protein K438DRAFT_1956369 [Mycena galopus ATCC 62051]|nr:hypothetical protein K438DRAFT_1956369 [Mycena galopus ATCC 62051]